MIRRPPRSTLSSSSAASDVYKRQVLLLAERFHDELLEVSREHEEAVAVRKDDHVLLPFSIRLAVPREREHRGRVFRDVRDARRLIARGGAGEKAVHVEA